jgi:hypothetical protein
VDAREVGFVVGPAAAGPKVGSDAGSAVDAPVTGPDKVAPPAGRAVRISGTTQAAAPAVANADMRPMAWRLE